MLVSSRVGPLQPQNANSSGLEDKPDSSLQRVKLRRSSGSVKVVRALHAEPRREFEQGAAANVTAEFRRSRTEFVKTGAGVSKWPDYHLSDG